MFACGAGEGGGHVCMLALIRLGACVCSVLREHVSTVFCKPVFSVLCEHACVHASTCTSVCRGDMCVCIHTGTASMYVCTHLHMRVSICMFVWLACVHVCLQLVYSASGICVHCLCMRV